MLVSDLLMRSGLSALKLQKEDGSMPAGHNGPHFDEETSVRNTGHWLIVWSFLWSLSGDKRIEVAANKAADYLMCSSLRPGGFTYLHRLNPKKDHCNGLMGPAFSIDALVEGARYLKRKDLLNLARELIFQHPFDVKNKLWLIREVNGDILGPDHTLNHQLWFAYAIANYRNLIADFDENENLNIFLDSLESNMILRRCGRVEHIVNKSGFIGKVKTNLITSLIYRNKFKKKEIAYHAYNLFPLALIKKMGVLSKFWDSRKLREAVEYLESDSYLNEAESEEFILPYVPAGFPFSYAERALINEIFEVPSVTKQARLIDLQFLYFFNKKSLFMDLRSVDPVTQSARIYELIHIPLNLSINLE